jgi:hypothetical protein
MQKLYTLYQGNSGPIGSFQLFTQTAGSLPGLAAAVLRTAFTALCSYSFNWGANSSARARASEAAASFLRRLLQFDIFFLDLHPCLRRRLPGVSLQKGRYPWEHWNPRLVHRYWMIRYSNQIEHRISNIEYPISNTEYRISSFNGPTDLYILPGYCFKVVDIMITNFHLPKSTLLMLVSAFAGRERILETYQTAVEAGYRLPILPNYLRRPAHCDAAHAVHDCDLSDHFRTEGNWDLGVILPELGILFARLNFAAFYQVPLFIPDRNVHGMNAKVMEHVNLYKIIILAFIKIKNDTQDVGRRQQIFLRERYLPFIRLANTSDMVVLNDLA